MSLNGISLAQLGRCAKIKITKDDTLIYGGAGDKQDVRERIAVLKGELKQATRTFEKDTLTERIGLIFYWLCSEGSQAFWWCCYPKSWRCF